MIPQTIQPGNACSLRRSNFNASLQTVIYIHGYSERSPGKSGDTIKNGECYVIHSLVYNLS